MPARDPVTAVPTVPLDPPAVEALAASELPGLVVDGRRVPIAVLDGVVTPGTFMHRVTA